MQSSQSPKLELSALNEIEEICDQILDEFTSDWEKLLPLELWFSIFSLLDERTMSSLLAVDKFSRDLVLRINHDERAKRINNRAQIDEGKEFSFRSYLENSPTIGLENFSDKTSLEVLEYLTVAIVFCNEISEKSLSEAKELDQNTTQDPKIIPPDIANTLRQLSKLILMITEASVFFNKKGILNLRSIRDAQHGVPVVTATGIYTGIRSIIREPFDDQDSVSLQTDLDNFLKCLADSSFTSDNIEERNSMIFKMLRNEVIKVSKAIIHYNDETRSPPAVKCFYFFKERISPGAKIVNEEKSLEKAAVTELTILCDLLTKCLNALETELKDRVSLVSRPSLQF